MKIEKISDTQIKFILSKEDLAGKDIKLEDLTSSTEKTKELFRDMLAKALEECGFSIDDAPLLIEALPIAMDSIMIIVTKIDSEEKENSSEDSETVSAKAKDNHKYKRKSINVHRSEPIGSTDTFIYSFEKLDDVIDVCIKTNRRTINDSSLYKQFGKYYLVVSVNKDSMETFEKFSYILGEYGQKQNATSLSKYRLMEYAETIIAEKAVDILAENFI